MSLVNLSNLIRLKALIDVSSVSECSISTVSSSLERLDASCRSAEVLACLEIFSLRRSRLRFLLALSNHILHSELQVDQ